MRITVEHNVECKMRDGAVLRANVYRPEDSDSGPYPVVLTRLPYGKDTNMAYAALDPIRLAQAGYIVVIQDVRGRFASEGTFQNSVQEFNDGYDSVEWASKINGSSGLVGMYGMSYFGYTQWAAAASGHERLKAIVPAIAYDSSFVASVRQGAIEWGMIASWELGAIAPYELVRQRGHEPDFPNLFGTLIHAYDHLTDNGYRKLPIYQLDPLHRLGILPDVSDQLSRPSFDEDWQRTSTREDYNDFSCNAFMIGGWFDVFIGSTLFSYQKLKEAGRETRLLIGPWAHTNWSSMIGDSDFGMAAGSSLIDLKQDLSAIHQQWFDYQLKGIKESGAKIPRVKIFVMGENQWRVAEDWPLPETVYTPFFLHSNGRANSKAGDGMLSLIPCMGEQPDCFTYDPANPVQTCGGNILMTPSYRPGPLDQSTVEERQDVLVYTSDPLTEPLTVIGPITAKLWVSSDALDTDFVVRLVDVFPNGTAHNVADGIVRMRYRESDGKPCFMNSGEVYEVTVDCLATATVFLPSHRIRVQVTSSCFPRWNRNLNTGESNETTEKFVVANQTVFHDSIRPSQIRLPIIP